jgi:hypothetical protein
VRGRERKVDIDVVDIADAKWLLLSLRDDSGRLVPPLFMLLLLAAALFLLMATVMSWARSQSPGP